MYSLDYCIFLNLLQDNWPIVVFKTHPLIPPLYA